MGYSLARAKLLRLARSSLIGFSYGKVKQQTEQNQWIE
jgi:hypothetical protein